MDAQRLEHFFTRYREGQLTLKRLMLDIQASFGVLHEGHLRLIHQQLGVSYEDMHHWIRITRSLMLLPESQHYLSICHGGSCGQAQHQAWQQPWIEFSSQHPDILYIQPMGCTGVCSLGPMVILDGQLYDHASINARLLNRLHQILEFEGTS